MGETVADRWAQLVADCRAAGLRRAVKPTDSLIAATAIEHGLSVVTQDEDLDTTAAVHPPLSVTRV